MESPFIPPTIVHRMPVITPAYPSMCATHNITSSTQKLLLLASSKEVLKLWLTSASERRVGDLFARQDFLQIQVLLVRCSLNEGSAEGHLKWNGMVESKLRILVQKLEN